MARPTQADTRSWVADLVRSGLGTPADVRRQVVEAVRADHPGLDAASTATDWIAEAEASWRAEAATWPETTDYDRLQAAFAALEAGGVVVLQGCADHWSARDELARHVPPPRGIGWFTPTDVWHAVEEGMLEVNLWHGTTANAAPGDDLLAEAIAAFGAAGLEAHFDEGRIEVAAHWRRRPGTG
ncbi:hypothetical protein EFK50_06315 [Nocardioides marmoriginsengisoli]|uniref:DUF6891 domain-containing protein n=1 Tax=Nocardioides marmoriginsengisoli TaxID=661483 RepID=A0A3N0CLC2_9ACTN|nr:hypothetical protein [Nocardioides marmoriginsengisoli]RNL64149.1 hypothetical protein EFK50_06315 [Nocardioides marmoriginsengisoli]